MVCGLAFLLSYGTNDETAGFGGDGGDFGGDGGGDFGGGDFGGGDF